MKWYTAVGVKRDGVDGRFYVRCASEEKILTGMEIQIWSALLWSFCEEKDIFGRMVGLLHLAFGKDGAGQRADEGEFWYCLRRLEREGNIDCHLRQLAVQAGQAASLVEGEDPGFAKSVQQEFLAGVIALYRKKHLLIESIKKEEFFEESKEAAGYAAAAGLHP